MSRKIGVDAQELYKWLCTAKVGELLLYSDLSALIGRDVQKDGYQALDSARRMAQKEDRIVFGVERNVGLRRLDDVGIVATGADGLARTRRMARKNAAVLACTENFDALPNDAKIKHNAAMSIYGAISQALAPKAIARAEKVVAETGRALPGEELLGLFV